VYGIKKVRSIAVKPPTMYRRHLERPLQSKLFGLLVSHSLYFRMRPMPLQTSHGRSS
jgi:hypothetical protein